MTASFESALQGRVDAMIDACTRCGKCVEVCPATEPAGLSTEQRQNPAEVIGGLIDLLRGSAGNDAARKWASGCLLSGECIKACDYGVNPRFLLGMTRVAMAKADVVILIWVMRRSGNAEVSDEPTNSQVLTIPHASERMEHRPRMRRAGEGRYRRKTKFASSANSVISPRKASYAPGAAVGFGRSGPES